MQDIQFQSQGATIAAHLYLPENANRSPAILLCHGFAGVKELLLTSLPTSPSHLPCKYSWTQLAEPDSMPQLIQHTGYRRAWVHLII